MNSGSPVTRGQRRLLRIIVQVAVCLGIVVVAAAILFPVFSTARHKGSTIGVLSGPGPAPPLEEPMLAEEAPVPGGEGEMMADRGAVSAVGETGVAVDIMATAEAASARKIIRTAEVTVQVEDLEGAQKRVLDLVESMGGFLSSLHALTADELRKDATIVARIPAPSFRQFWEQVQQLGEPENPRVGGQDVTEQYMDLERSIANKRVLEERFRELAKRTGKVADLLQVERELARVRGEIEQYQGRLRYLKDQVQFSTVTVHLYQLGEAPLGAGAGWKLAYHLKGAWHGLILVLQALSQAVIYGVIVPLPFWALLLILIAAVRARARRRSQAPPSSEGE